MSSIVVCVEFFKKCVLGFADLWKKCFNVHFRDTDMGAKTKISSDDLPKEHESTREDFNSISERMRLLQESLKR